MISVIRSGLEWPRFTPHVHPAKLPPAKASHVEGANGVTRKLWPSERQAFLDHLLRLDPDTRRERFGSSVKDAFLIRYAESTFGIGGLVYAYIEDDVVRGAAELREPDATHDRRAEAAFSVEAGWRERGIGSTLFASLVRAASNRRIATLDIVCLPRNRAMRKLAAKFGVAVTLRPDGITGSLRIDPPTAASATAEALDDMAGVAAAGLALQRRAWRRLQAIGRAA